MPRGIYNRKKTRKYTKKGMSAKALLIAAGKWCNSSSFSGLVKGNIYTASDLLIYLKSVVKGK